MRHFFIMKDMRRIIRLDRRKENKLEALVISTNDSVPFYNEMPYMLSKNSLHHYV